MENTSKRPKSRQQINHEWSNVQTVTFETPPSPIWGPVQTTKYETQSSAWEAIQTTPLGKEVATTQYEPQNHTWGPISTAQYSKPVVWGSPEAAYNMALKHQVFGE
jgi:hypothetical protein